MNQTPAVFDVSALKRLECACRKQLSTHPDNMELRMRLAWCLFLQAMHQAGQEQERAAMGTLLSPPEDKGETERRDRNAQMLLEDCLHQTFTVRHLSAQTQDRWDVDKLQALVGMMGGSAVVLQAEDWAMRILADLMGDKIPGASVPQGGY